MSFQRAYRLTPVQDRGDDCIAPVRIAAGAGAGVNVLLPHAIGLGYFVVPTSRARVSIAAAEFRVETVDPLTSLWARLRLSLLFKKKKYLEYDGFSVFSVGPKPERKRFTSFNQDTVNLGAGVDSDLVAAHPELLSGWSTAKPDNRLPPGGASRSPVAVVVHLYYEETWPDIAGALSRLPFPFDLIVTTVPGRERIVEAVRRDFPLADIEVMENRGRDVRPFLVLLERGRLDRYRYLCKVHGKKSTDGGRKSYMGALWRRRLLFDLIAAPGRRPIDPRHVRARPLDRHDRAARVPHAEQNLFGGAVLVGQSGEGARTRREDGHSS